MECVNFNCEWYHSDYIGHCSHSRKIPGDDLKNCPNYIPPASVRDARVCVNCRYSTDSGDCLSGGCNNHSKWKPKETPEERVREYDKSVKHPPHYTAYPLEVIEIIKLILDEIDRRGIKLTSFEAACLKDEIKYRFRAGLKGDAAEDIAKAMQYKEFREKK